MSHRGISHASAAPSSRSESFFELKTSLAGFCVEIKREGKHKNLHVVSQYDNGDGVAWNFEPLEQAFPKLEALYKAAKLLLEDDKPEPKCSECFHLLHGYRGPRCRYCDGTAE